MQRDLTFWKVEELGFEPWFSELSSFHHASCLSTLRKNLSTEILSFSFGETKTYGEHMESNVSEARFTSFTCFCD